MKERDRQLLRFTDLEQQMKIGLTFKMADFIFATSVRICCALSAAY